MAVARGPPARAARRRSPPHDFHDRDRLLVRQTKKRSRSCRAPQQASPTPARRRSRRAAVTWRSTHVHRPHRAHRGVRRRRGRLASPGRARRDRPEARPGGVPGTEDQRKQQQEAAQPRGRTPAQAPRAARAAPPPACPPCRRPPCRRPPCRRPRRRHRPRGRCRLRCARCWCRSRRRCRHCTACHCLATVLSPDAGVLAPIMTLPRMLPGQNHRTRRNQDMPGQPEIGVGTARGPRYPGPVPRIPGAGSGDTGGGFSGYRGGVLPIPQAGYRSPRKCP